MKKTYFLIVFSLTIGFVNAQEWFTSLEVAQRLALVQNKMLFVIAYSINKSHASIFAFSKYTFPPKARTPVV